MIAVWASVFRKKITGNVRMDADDWLKENDKYGEELYYDFCLESNDFPGIFTPDVNEYLTRHKMLKDYNISSFATEFDNLPAIWVDAIEIIDVNVTKAMEAKNRR